jgi:hypothetical protein
VLFCKTQHRRQAKGFTAPSYIVVPRLDRGIQYKRLRFLKLLLEMRGKFLYWIPRSSRGTTKVGGECWLYRVDAKHSGSLVHVTKACCLTADILLRNNLRHATSQFLPRWNMQKLIRPMCIRCRSQNPRY